MMALAPQREHNSVDGVIQRLVAWCVKKQYFQVLFSAPRLSTSSDSRSNFLQYLQRNVYAVTKGITISWSNLVLSMLFEFC